MTTAVVAVPAAAPARRPGGGAPVPYHPPCFDLWSDIGSIGHVLLGWYAGEHLTPANALGVFALFAGYQIAQTHGGESWPRVGSELIEFGLGVFLANARRR